MNHHVVGNLPHRLGVVLAATGFALVSVGISFPVGDVAAQVNVFQGNCVGTADAGTCVLDEPEGNNAATHGLVTYARTAAAMSYIVEAVDAISEVQICMQATEPFDQAANACAGVHGHHVAFGAVGNVYTVDLATEGFANTNPLYWTLHVVAGGRTLQVLSALTTPTSTTTTTTTTIQSTTTTAVPTTTTTTEPPSTTTTTEPPTTTTTAEPPSTTTTTDPGTTTTTVPPTTTTTGVVQVLGETLSRTGGPSWWMLVVGAALLVAGLSLELTTRLRERRS